MKKLILVVLCIFLSSCKLTSEGSKVGIIVKCAEEGFFINTYECEIIRGGMSGASGTLGQSFHFTVEDKSLKHNFDQALNDQKEVRLYYHKEWFVMPWRSETKDNSFADKIEFIR